MMIISRAFGCHPLGRCAWS